MSYVLAIDVGTSFTAAAIATLDPSAPPAPEILPLGLSGSAVPSVVYYPDDGPVLVGESTERHGVDDPGRVVREFKGRVGGSVPFAVGALTLPAEEIFATVARWVVDRAEERTGAPPAEIIITHPASWGAQQTSAVLTALAAGGLPGVTLIIEPEAAALHNASPGVVEDGSTIAVCEALRAHLAAAAEPAEAAEAVPGIPTPADVAVGPHAAHGGAKGLPAGHAHHDHAHVAKGGAHAPRPAVRLTALAAGAALFTILSATAAQSPAGLSSLTAMLAPDTTPSQTDAAVHVPGSVGSAGGGLAAAAPGAQVGIEASAKPEAPVASTGPSAGIEAAASPTSRPSASALPNSGSAPGAAAVSTPGGSGTSSGPGVAAGPGTPVQPRTTSSAPPANTPAASAPPATKPPATMPPATTPPATPPPATTTPQPSADPAPTSVAPAPAPTSVAPAPAPAPTSVAPAPAPAPAPTSVAPAPAPAPAPTTVAPAPAPSPAPAPTTVAPAPVRTTTAAPGPSPKPTTVPAA